MDISILGGKNNPVALLDSNMPLITDAQSALDLIMTIGYEHGTYALVLNKEAVSEAFFDLKTGVAGEITQKFSNYRSKLAVVGDFSQYTSKALKDYIYECNKGNTILFVSTVDEAVKKFTQGA